MSTKKRRVLSLFLALVMVFSLLPVAGLAAQNDTSEQATSDEFMKIVFLDCGRKYFSVDSIKKIIDNAAAAGFNYIQLAVGNDGLRFLLEDMSLEVGEKSYNSKDVTAAIHAGNEAYHDFEIDELVQSEMNEIIDYAHTRGLSVIPCVNTPGHMDAILAAAKSLTGVTCAYQGSARTIDVTNETAVAFTQALLQKYIAYFADKGCTYFNMGADEYANDKSTGSMGFGQLQQSRQYGKYVTYVNQVAGLVKNAGMTPMAFNDGIYYNSDEKSGTFDTDIVICYWSNGWTGYTPASVEFLARKNFKLVNTHGDYYWVLGKTDAQCSSEKASRFYYTSFPGGTVSDPAGAMFCIWCDYPGEDTAENVIQKTADTISAFGGTLPKTEQPVPSQPTISSDIDLGSVVTGKEFTLSLSEGTTAEWKSSNPDVISIYATRGTVSANSVTVKALKAGSATITATLANGTAVTKDITVTNLPTKDFTIAVGETKTDTQAGNYPGPYSGYDSSIATVSGVVKEIAGSTGAPIKQTTLTSGSKYIIGDGNGHYLKREGRSLKDVTSPDEATVWTVVKNSDGTWKIEDGYYLLNHSNNGLGVGQNNATAWTYDSTNGFYYSSRRTSYYLCCDTSGWTVSSNATNKGAAYVKGTQTPSGYETTISFTGVAVGDTTVEIGGTRYNIHVVSEDLTKVTPLKIEYWITNARLIGSGGNQELTINATDNGVATEAGVDVTTLVAPTGSKDNRTQEFWQTKILDVSEKNDSTSGTELQTTISGDDETLNGDAFTKVRYYGGTWQVYTSSWVAVDRTQTQVTYKDGNTDKTYSGDRNQLVAYYMEVVDIKNANDKSELHVNAADWGTKGDGTGNWGYTPESNRCSVSIQIVYEDSTTNPAGKTADSLKSKTIVYGYWDGGRGLGTMIFTGQEPYQIYKVSAETGTMESTATSSNQVTVTKFAWADNEETVWEGDPSDSVSIGNPAKSPSYDSPYDNLAWNTSKYNENNAILIRVYVKAKATKDSLRVNYYDEAASREPFYSYNIDVENGTVFNEDFQQSDDGKLINNTVTNSNGQTQTVQSDLSLMPEISAQYRYVDYKCVKVERLPDGKIVNLYYTFSSEKTFVIDYGLPIKIEPTDISASLGKATINKVSVTSVTSPSYGDIKINNDTEKSFTYTPNKMMSGSELLNVTYEGSITVTGENGKTTQKGSVTYTITILPASTMYYEENFVKFSDDHVAGATWEKEGAATTMTQALEELGDEMNNLYGYDPAYAASTQHSMGAAKKVTVSNTMTNVVKDGATWPTATFTFTGTGFDVISLTNNASGAIFVTVKDKEGTPVKSYMVNNYYGYTHVDGKWVVDEGSKDTLYQIPVMKVSGLDYGSYTVEIKVAYASLFDMTDAGQYTFWLDAIRIYDPMGTNVADYAQDNEGYPQYTNFHQLMLKDETPNRVVFIDGTDEATVTDYKSYGPNNEVYLAKDQAIAFKVSTDANIATVQVGAKAPSGTAASMVVSSDVNSNVSSTTEIKTATDMYYDITTAANGGTVTITNKGSGILSLTNLKITYEKAPGTGTTTALAALTDADQEAALKVVRSLFAVEAPEIEPFVPQRFEAKWDRSVTAGRRATLTVKTSEDVAAISVDGQTIDSYRTYTERSGRGWNATRVTYRVFTYTATPTETTDYTVTALNSDGVASAPITATLTVTTQRPGGWWGWWY